VLKCCDVHRSDCRTSDTRRKWSFFQPNRLHDRFVHLPIDLLVTRKKQIDPDGLEWAAVLAATGQPARFD